MSWIDQGPFDTAWTNPFDALGREAPKTVDPALFRDAMTKLGAAVHVVTTAGPAGRTGFTATAVCSVSDNPPTLLVCLNNNSRNMPPLRANGTFCVNTLGAEAEEIADVFAGRTGAAMEQRFHVGEWMTLSTGSPVLRSAVMAFDCRTVDVKTVATHNVFFALIESIHIGEPSKALVYHEREYKHV